MFKKLIFLFISFLFCAVLITGCSINIEKLAQQSVSERVEIYFSGKGDFIANISCGEREDPYEYDGVSNELKEYSLVTIYTDSQSSTINADITINNQTNKITLERDVLSSSYLFDLGYKLNQDDIITILYNNETIELSCISKDFNINYEQAFTIALESFSSEIESLVSKKNLNAECYLRILDDPNDIFNRRFWYFYIYAENGTSHYCVINIEDGNILTKN